MQDAFVTTYTHWEGLRDPDSAPAYLRSAVINRCRSRIRDKLRERGRPMLLVDHAGTSSEEAVLDRTDRSRVAEAVALLPRRQREVLVCRYYLELSVAETAEILGIGAGSVKQHAHRGIAALTSRLGEVLT